MSDFKNTERKAALLVVFHGSRSDASADVARQCYDAIATRGEWSRVALAWLQFRDPTVAQSLEELANFGAREIVVAPVLVLPGRHLGKDLPEAIADFRRRRPDCRVTMTSALALEAGFASLVSSMARGAIDLQRDETV